MKLQHDELLSNYAYNCNVRRYIEARKLAALLNSINGGGAKIEDVATLWPKLGGRHAAPLSAESGSEDSVSEQSAEGGAEPQSAERAAAVLSEKSRRVLSPAGTQVRHAPADAAAVAAAAAVVAATMAGTPVRNAPADAAVAAAAAVMAAAGAHTRSLFSSTGAVLSQTTPSVFHRKCKR